MMAHSLQFPQERSEPSGPPPLTDAQLLEAKLLAERKLKPQHTGYDTSKNEQDAKQTLKYIYESTN